MTGRLVGRAAEKPAVTSAIDGALAGGSEILRISGEPGIGKTRILTWLARHTVIERGRGKTVDFASFLSYTAFPERDVESSNSPGGRVGGPGRARQRGSTRHDPGRVSTPRHRDPPPQRARHRRPSALQVNDDERLDRLARERGLVLAVLAVVAQHRQAHDLDFD